MSSAWTWCDFSWSEKLGSEDTTSKLKLKGVCISEGGSWCGCSGCDNAPDSSTGRVCSDTEQSRKEHGLCADKDDNVLWDKGIHDEVGCKISGDIELNVWAGRDNEDAEDNPVLQRLDDAEGETEKGTFVVADEDGNVDVIIEGGEDDEGGSIDVVPVENEKLDVNPEFEFEEEDEEEEEKEGATLEKPRNVGLGVRWDFRENGLDLSDSRGDLNVSLLVLFNTKSDDRCSTGGSGGGTNADENENENGANAFVSTSGNTEVDDNIGNDDDNKDNEDEDEDHDEDEGADDEEDNNSDEVEYEDECERGNEQSDLICDMGDATNSVVGISMSLCSGDLVGGINFKDGVWINFFSFSVLFSSPPSSSSSSIFRDAV